MTEKFRVSETGLVFYERKTKTGIRVEILTPKEAIAYVNRGWLVRIIEKVKSLLW
jgi:hypothetical protein